ncbi:putative response regulator receiver domain-containing protein [Phaeoacremonium minimum UCRPA7]|uniref:Putative response regulator receiver domain-containing protein n=1 Tax=Phaeoacremonium minimum (strain UCR-PA7) TaxID=1286976 RepID=R8BFX2_PHAM7|nr:putative response regulator receiver domain-containing protein [Phaeoacremonium minimum UCRPA7]EON98187.1 putative response regulator receiver domain-containing protein [Phaeoacremonium minimum UCRPA7]
MGDLKARIRAKFSRKNSAAASSLASSTSSRAGSVSGSRSSQQPPSIHHDHHQHQHADLSPDASHVRQGDKSTVSVSVSVTDERRQSPQQHRKGGLEREGEPKTTHFIKAGPEDGVADTSPRRSTASSRDRTPLEQQNQQHSTGSNSSSGGGGGVAAVEGAAAAGGGELTRINSAASGDAMATDQRLSTGKLSSINEHGDFTSAADQQPQPTTTTSVALTVAGPTTLDLVPVKDSASDHDLHHDPFLSPALTTPTARPGAITLPVSGASPTTVSLAGSALRPSPSPSPSLPRPGLLPRRQSLFSNGQTTLIRTLLNGGEGDQSDPANANQLIPIIPNMVTRKIWVKRPGASATLVTINEDDVVDDVREMILRKYANSLGRNFDAPDLTLRIKPREQLQERTLGPEEPMSRTLDAYFPGGQTVDEALIIDVPLRRITPRASPRTGPPHAPHITSAYYADETRPSEAGNDYFGPSALSTANIPVTVTAASTGSGHHAISILSTGQIPQIPSPGGTRSRPYRERPERPRLGRQHTSSPTILNMATGVHPASIASTANHDHSNTAPVPPPLPTPPAPDAAAIQRVATPPPRVASPRPTGTVRTKKSKKTAEPPSLPPGMLNGTVPPINVLIVEDNIINLKLLEAFVKRLKVRWQTAMNGREAVNKWRTGGFHLVLMDIQLPVMSGLDATREIRRLERVNSIGVFSSSASSVAPEETNGQTKDEDRLSNTDMFKSPVIIVALTASSLQSDRHEALAAGCNDFLTKPVSFVWLERKVMEWGCMQALIDFDGWRKWKDYSQKADEAAEEAKKKAAAANAKKKRNRQSLNAS